MGKTQLAVEFAYRYGRFFHGVHWLNGAQPDAIGAEVAGCGAALALPNWPEKQPAQVARTLDEWHRGGPRLVILDNLEQVSAAREWLARLSGGGVHLLLTARCSDWPADLGLTPLRLDVFTPDESREFLGRHVQTSEVSQTSEVLDALAERLGHLPLALELAGRYLARHRCLTVAAYLDRLERVLTHPSMEGWRAELGNPTGHDLDLAATFALSWEQVTEGPSRRLFRLAGYCAPNQPIPHKLLQRALQTEVSTGFWKRLTRLFKKRPQMDYDEALDGLTGLGLLQMEDPDAGPTIHPLLAEYARNRVSEASEPLPALADALMMLTHQANETGLPARFVPLRPHVEAVAAAAQEAGLEKAGTLWNNLGYHLRMVADYAGARASYERALAIWRAAYGEEHPDVATAHNNLGLVLQDLGDLAGARVALERALAIDERGYGPDHPDVATDVNNLGLVLQALGDLAGARAAFERALAIDE
ncbi:MAG: tetratricopeptide repeat protein, partial [Anaerolineae bacterium]|nr:tetratricopeptide repeat protein [Anaerolineae bacterium]